MTSETIKRLGFDLQLFAVVNDPFQQVSRYLRRGKRPPSAGAVDLTVTPSGTALSSPGAPTLTPSTTGGVLPAGTTYNYRVSALVQTSPGVWGETVPGAEGTAATTTGSTSSITVTWAAVTGATAYRVYGRNTGAELLLAQVNSTTFIDTGVLTPSGAIPASNTTAATATMAGQINAGDMVYLTAAGKLASMNTPGASNANAASIVGVSEDNYPFLLMTGVPLGAPPLDTTAAFIAYRSDGEFKFKTTPGETYTPEQALYAGADAQTITNVASGTSIGKVSLDQRPVGGALGVSVVGAVGQELCVDFVAPNVVA